MVLFSTNNNCLFCYFKGLGFIDVKLAGTIKILKNLAVLKILFQIIPTAQFLFSVDIFTESICKTVFT